MKRYEKKSFISLHKTLFSILYKSVYRQYRNPLPLGMGQLQNPPTKDVNGIAFYGSILAVKSYKGVCGISRLSGNSFKKGLYLFKYKDNKIYILENPF